MCKSERQKLQGDLVIEGPPYSEYWRKLFSSCFWQGRGKRNHFEVCQIILFFLIKSALRKNYLARA